MKVVIDMDDFKPNEVEAYLWASQHGKPLTEVVKPLLEQMYWAGWDAGMKNNVWDFGEDMNQHTSQVLEQLNK